MALAASRDLLNTSVKLSQSLCVIYNWTMSICTTNIVLTEPCRRTTRAIIGVLTYASSPIEDTWKELKKLKEEGKVKYLGI